MATVRNAVRHRGEAGSRRCFFTLLGGGVFGNSVEWIVHAIERACLSLRHFALDVVIVSYGDPEKAVLETVARINREVGGEDSLDTLGKRKSP